MTQTFTGEQLNEVTSENTYIINQYATAYKFGKLVILVINGDNFWQNSVYQVYINLPSEIKPNATYPGILAGNAGAATLNTSVAMQVRTDGTVTMFNPSAVTAFYGSIIYFTE
ncbi:precorrin-4 methylase [Breznakia sp. PFB1-19]|nr:precorrin-4 methylase [Breznakia sp. PFB1-4]MDH6474354.1 precorrin-4 methylase [Breznakia sp. PFB2-30]MDH6476416.1 precorrin-4 methylase [Breznakia sp. PFB1-19]